MVYEKFAQQLPFEYLETPESGTIKQSPEYDAEGAYWTCVDCGRKIRSLEDIKEYRYAVENKLFQVGKFEKQNIDQVCNALLSQIERFKNIGAEDIYNRNTYEIPNYNYEGYRFLNNMSNLNNDAVTSVLGSLGLILGVSGRDKFCGLHYETMITINDYGSFLNKKIPPNKKYEEVKDLVRSAINEYIQEKLNKLHEFSQIAYSLIGKPIYSQMRVKIEHPLCNNCYDEQVIHCDYDGCDFESTDEDDFVEVEEYNWEDGKRVKNTVLLCKDEHGDECYICDKGLDVTSDDVTKYDGHYYHSECWSEVYDYCARCNEVIDSDNAYYTEDSDGPYCSYCFRNMQKENAFDEDSMSVSVRKVPESLYPIDSKTIVGNIIPALEAAYKKFNNKINEHSINFIISRLQKQESKAAVNTELNNCNNISDVINVFKGNIEYDKSIREKYPALKGFRPIPCDISVENAGSDHPGSVYALYPNKRTMEFAEALHPGTRDVYLKYLKDHGHHDGALAYIRITDDNDNIIIDNIQTDIDMQWVNKYYFKGRIEKETNLTNERIEEIKRDKDRTDEEKESLINKLKENNEELCKSFDITGKALAWWAQSISKFFVPFLLDLVKQFAEKTDRKAYITSFEMQKRKWGTLPNKTEDFYEAIPEQMGFKQEEISAKPESLNRDEYLMRRMAKKILRRILKNGQHT